MYTPSEAESNDSSVVTEFPPEAPASNFRDVGDTTFTLPSDAVSVVKVAPVAPSKLAPYDQEGI